MSGGGGGAAGEVTTYIKPNNEREPAGETTSLLLEGTKSGRNTAGRR